MVPSRMISVLGNEHLPGRTRVIWKVGSIIFYFSNRFTNLSMFGVATCDFQQCDVLTSVDSDEPVQPPVKFRNTK